MPPAVVMTAASCAQHAIERASLLAAERGGAGHFDQVRNAGAIFLFDPTIELDERPAECFASIRPRSTCRRLAGRPMRRGARDRRCFAAPAAARCLLPAPAGPCPALARLIDDGPNAALRTPVSGSKAAVGSSSARAMARSTLTEGLPVPLSICARYRSGGGGAFRQLPARQAAAWRDVCAPPRRWRRGTRESRRDGCVSRENVRKPLPLTSEVATDQNPHAL